MAYANIILAALATSSLLSFTRAAVPSIEGFTTTWSDDFEGSAYSQPDTAKWKAMTGTQYEGGAANWGTNEIQTVSHLFDFPYPRAENVAS